MTTKAYRYLISTALVISLVSLPVLGQIVKQGTGSINGTVTDDSGLPVPGVGITVTGNETSSVTETVTDDNGRYLAHSLAIHQSYDVTASLEGFKSYTASGQRVASDQTSTVDVVLSIGDVTETVTVSGQAQVIQTTDTTVAHAQDAEVLEVLPVNMQFYVRQSMVLINTLPGVIYRPTWDGNKGIIHGVGGDGPHRSPIGYNTDGHQSSINWHQGLRDETGPAPELIEEFRVETNQDAEKGFNSGVSVEMITKSGTNDFHGSLFWFHRNHAFDSRKTTASSIGEQRQNEWGWVLGGPIVKDKAFFMMNFTGYEWLTKPTGTLATVQTDAMRGGNFNENLGAVIGADALGRDVHYGQIYDPLTTRAQGTGFIRDPFPNNTIPADRIGDVAKHLMTLYPGPNIAGAGLTNNYSGENEMYFDIDKTYLKTDIELDNHKFTIGYEDTPNNKLGFISPAHRLNSVAVETRGYRIRLHHLWTLSPTVLLSTRTGINRITYGEAKMGVAYNGCPGGCVEGALTTAIPRISMQSRTGGGFGDNTDMAEHFQGTLPSMMDVSWLKGNHSFKFGSQVSIYTGRVSVENHTAGSYTFKNVSTGLVEFPDTGDGFAAFLLGDVFAVNQSTASTKKVTSISTAFFAQDSWRVNQRLTVNYGLRWEVPIPMHESYNRWGIMDLYKPNAAAGGLPGAITHWGEGAGRNGRNRISSTNYMSFGPRLGIAYKINDKTVFRGYYGYMFYPSAGELGNGLSIPMLGFSADYAMESPDGGWTPAINWEDGIDILPAVPNLDPTIFNGSNQFFVDYNENEQGAAQRIGLALEHELPWNLLGRVEYIGLLGHSIGGVQIARYNQLATSYMGLGNMLTQNINSEIAQDAGYTAPYAGFNGTVGQSLRRFPQYGYVAQMNSHSTYNLYHSGIFMLQKRFSDGLNFMFSHTIAKGLTPGDNKERAGFGPRGGSKLQHWDLLPFAKTLVPFNRSWATKLSFAWQLPIGLGKRYANDIGRLGDTIIGGWQIAGMLVYHAGQPLTVDSGQVNPYMGPQWANWNYGVGVGTGRSCSKVNDQIFNPAAYSLAPAFSFGNARVHPSAQNCGFMQEDISIVKDFQIHEEFGIRIGLEMMNAFNRRNWKNAGSSVGSSGFGIINNTLDPKTMQVYVKVNF